jgi:hypothetical protein
MVWGMSLPSTFGEFWPDGSFEGVDKNDIDLWLERLRLHYLEQTAEEQRRLFDHGDKHVGHGAGNYPFYAANKFKWELGHRSSPEDPPISAIEPHEPPHSFVTNKTYQRLGSLIALNYGLMAVDMPLKTLIEQLEPGVHQFASIEIRMPRRVIFPAQYHVLVVGQFLDSFSPSNSKSGSWGDFGPDYPNTFSFNSSAAGISGLALSRAKFGEAHLWRERSFTSILVCFSDALMAQITKAGLRLPKHTRMLEVRS